MKLDLGREELQILSSEILQRLHGMVAPEAAAPERNRQSISGRTEKGSLPQTETARILAELWAEAGRAGTFLEMRREPETGEQEALPVSEIRQTGSTVQENEERQKESGWAVQSMFSGGYDSLEAASEYLCRDSRRYDAELKKY